jgi:ArsR family transcriptional regulator
LSKYKNIKLNAVFKALNDPIRRAILNHLKQQDLTAGAIADLFNISKPSISHHLEILKQAHLVTVEKKGQYMLYSIHTTVLDEVMAWMLSIK